jgi:hypothetical protein
MLLNFWVRQCVPLLRQLARIAEDDHWLPAVIAGFRRCYNLTKPKGYVYEILLHG